MKKNADINVGHSSSYGDMQLKFLTKIDEIKFFTAEHALIMNRVAIYGIDPMNNKPVGKLVLDQRGDNYFVVLAAISPEYQNRKLMQRLYIDLIVNFGYVLFSDNDLSLGAMKLWAMLNNHPDIDVSVMEQVDAYLYKKIADFDGDFSDENIKGSHIRLRAQEKRI